VSETCSPLDGAVSLAFLQSFASEVAAEWGAEGGPSSEEVVRTHVLPRTAELACRYADHPELIEEDQLGRATFYVCHMWSNRFQLLVESVSRQLAGAQPASTFLFLDMFSVNQHPSADRANDIRVRHQSGFEKRPVLYGHESRPHGHVHTNRPA